MVGKPGESGGTLARNVRELPSDGNNLVTETVSGSDGVFLSDKTDDTAKPEPYGTVVPAEEVDSMRQALRDYTKAVRKRAFIQKRQMRTNRTTGKVADVFSQETEAPDFDKNDTGTTGRSETPPDTSMSGMLEQLTAAKQPIQ